MLIGLNLYECINAFGKSYSGVTMMRQTNPTYTTVSIRPKPDQNQY